MKFMINIFIIIILGLIVFQDVKYREIHWALFLTLGLMFITSGLLNITYSNYIKACVFNLLFLLIQLCLLLGYHLIQKLPLKSIVNVTIGLGDIAFLGVIVFAFSEVNFVLFYISGMIFSLIIWLLIQLFPIPNRKLVPLAGLLSFYLIIVLLLDFSTIDFDRLNDIFLIHLIYG